MTLFLPGDEGSQGISKGTSGLPGFVPMSCSDMIRRYSVSILWSFLSGLYIFFFFFTWHLSWFYTAKSLPAYFMQLDKENLQWHKKRGGLEVSLWNSLLLDILQPFFSGLSLSSRWHERQGRMDELLLAVFFPQPQVAVKPESFILCDSLPSGFLCFRWLTLCVKNGKTKRIFQKL